MGFDIYGTKATSKKGEYFRNNVWWWKPLADYVTSNCKISNEDWDNNSGHEVSEADSIKIADTLDKLIKLGHTKKYEKDYTASLKKLPLVKCDLCKGTGKRDDEYLKGECNVCKGTGKEKDFKTHYPFSEENVKDFSEFCRESGGFTIS